MRINNDYYEPERELQGDFVYEMSDPLKILKRDLQGYGGEVYHHVIYICVLGNKLPYEQHWKDEIVKFCRPLITRDLKKKCDKVDRGKLVKQEMMSHFMGAKFEDYDISQFEYALQCEINSAKRMLRNESLKERWPSIKREMKIVMDVQQHLDGIPEKCLETIKQFYDELCIAATNRDMTLVEEAVEKLHPII
jgi:hypothetical protein